MPVGLVRRASRGRGRYAIIGSMGNHRDHGLDGGFEATEASTAGDQLARELHRLGIRHLGWTRDVSPGSFTPISLLVRLAESPEARLRAALVPLFLLRPDYAEAAPLAADEIAGRARVVLTCAYSAAVALKGEYVPRLTGLSTEAFWLPDHFAEELEVPAVLDPDLRLAAIADRQARSSGEDINWCGTYRHAVESCLRFMKTPVGQAVKRIGDRFIGSTLEASPFRHQGVHLLAPPISTAMARQVATLHLDAIPDGDPLESAAGTTEASAG